MAVGSDVGEVTRHRPYSAAKSIFCDHPLPTLCGRSALLKAVIGDLTLLHVAGDAEMVWNTREISAVTGTERLLQFFPRLALRRKDVFSLPMVSGNTFVLPAVSGQG